MKQARITRIYRGFQLDVCFCCKTKKDAIKLLDVTMYELNTHGYFTNPKIKECVENPYLKFVNFSIMSGEMRLIKPEWTGKIIKYKDVIDYINEHRKVFKSHSETIKQYI